MEDNHHLHHPLLTPFSTTSAVPPPRDDNVHIIFRLSLVLFIAIVSIWANHEASKGYSITIVNDSGDTVAGRRFNLLYVSNDEATRIIIKASNTIENFLYPDYDSTYKKSITRVVIRLADRNLTEKVVVLGSNQEFVINLSPSILEGQNFRHDMNVALRQGVARMWLWDCQGTTPKSLIEGMVEYLVNYIGRFVVVSESSTVVEFLNHCERRHNGFIRRLNEAMKDGCDEKRFYSETKSLLVHDVCTTYESLWYNSRSE